MGDFGRIWVKFDHIRHFHKVAVISVYSVFLSNTPSSHLYTWFLHGPFEVETHTLVGEERQAELANLKSISAKKAAIFTQFIASLASICYSYTLSIFYKQRLISNGIKTSQNLENLKQLDQSFWKTLATISSNNRKVKMLLSNECTMQSFQLM